MKTPQKGRNIQDSIREARQRDRSDEERREEAASLAAVDELLARCRAYNECRHPDAYLKHDGPLEVGKRYPFFCPACLRTLQS